MYGENDATKVVTIRISEKEYKELQEIVKKNRGRWYPRPTISAEIRRMIQFCLKNHKKEFIDR